MMEGGGGNVRLWHAEAMHTCSILCWQVLVVALLVAARHARNLLVQVEEVGGGVWGCVVQGTGQ